MTKVPSQDEMKKREELLEGVIDHVKTMNPLNSSWRRYGSDVREVLPDGSAKLKNYHGFDITCSFLVNGNRIVLEYGGETVLNMSYETHYGEQKSWGRESNIEIYDVELKPGKWEKAFGKIIKMGVNDAPDKYYDRLQKNMETSEKKRRAEQNKRDNRELALRQQENRAVRYGFKL